MAVFPLENGVFSGTLLRFNVRGYVYIWSLIFSMFKFFVGVFVGVGVLMGVRCDLCVLVAYVHCAFSLCVYLGKWGNGIYGEWEIGY